MAFAASTPSVACTPAALPRVKPSEMTSNAEGPGLKQRKNSVTQKNAQVFNVMQMTSIGLHSVLIVRERVLGHRGLLRFQPRIVILDALCVAQNTPQFGISYVAPRICRVGLSLSRQRLIVQARFRRLTSLVMRKLAPDI